MEEWRGLTGAAGADHHEAVVQHRDLVQRDHLGGDGVIVEWSGLPLRSVFLKLG